MHGQGLPDDVIGNANFEVIYFTDKAISQIVCKYSNKT